VEEETRSLDCPLTDLRARIEVFRALFRKSRACGLTPEAQDALADLAETIRALLGEIELP
jgi:hypothetical protein